MVKKETEVGKNISSFAELAEDRFKEYKEYYMEYNEVSRELAEKLLRKADEIILQHDDEILELFGKLEWFTRINLRYVSENDLPMHLSNVIQMREEYGKERHFWKISELNPEGKKRAFKEMS